MYKPQTTPIGTGGWAGTNFTQTHKQYLVGIGVTGPFFHNLTDPPSTDLPVASEQGADAIADLAKYFDWSTGACRAIFCVSDTTLDGGDKPAIFTANRQASDWYTLFPNPVVAESILDRIVNSAHHVYMDGRSFRPNKRPGSAKGRTT